MKREWLPTKYFIKNGLIGGSIYAFSNAIFDYTDEIPFSITKFIYNFVVFGFLIAIFFSHKEKKK